MDETRRELDKVNQEVELKDVPVLIFMTKQDLPNAMSPAEAIETLRFAELLKGRVWDVIGTSIKDEASVYRALQRLVDMCKQAKVATANKPSNVVESAEKEERLVNLEGREGIFKVISSETSNAKIESVDNGEQLTVSPRLLREVEFAPNRAERKAEGMASLFIGWLKRVDEDDDVFISKVKLHYFILFFFNISFFANRRFVIILMVLGIITHICVWRTSCSPNTLELQQFR